MLVNTSDPWAENCDTLYFQNNYIVRHEQWSIYNFYQGLNKQLYDLRQHSDIRLITIYCYDYFLQIMCMALTVLYHI